MFARGLARSAAAAALLAGVLGAVPSPAAAAPLAPAVTASAEASAGTIHPYSTFALPDVILGQMGISEAELDAAPRAGGIAGPFYVPAAGLLGLIGLPSVPPQLMPYCQSYFPGDPPSASCVGPRQGSGGVTFAFANGQTESTGDFTDLSKLSAVSSVHFGGADGNGFSAGGGLTAAAVKAAEGRWTAESSLKLEHLAIGDVLTIDAITSSATGALNGAPGSGTASRRLAVTGAKVGGQPVDITTDGVVVAGGPGMGAEQAKTFQASVDSALKQANLTVRLVPEGDVKVAPDGTSVVADSGGVMVAFNAPRPVPPGNGFEMVFGRSVVRMSAYNPDAGSIGLGAEVGSSGATGGNGSEAPRATVRGALPSTPAARVGPLAVRGLLAASSSGGAAGDPLGGPVPESASDGAASAGRAVSDEAATGAPLGDGVGANAMRGGSQVAPTVHLASAAQTAPLRDGNGLGVRQVFLLLGVLAVAGPLLILARRIRLVLGG